MTQENKEQQQPQDVPIDYEKLYLELLEDMDSQGFNLQFLAKQRKMQYLNQKNKGQPVQR